MTDIASIGYRVDSSGIQIATTRLNGMAQAADRVENGATALQQRLNSLTGVTRETANSAYTSAQAFEAFDRAKRSVDALRASYDPVFAASKKYEAQLNELNAALDIGVINQQQYADMAQRLGQSTLNSADSVDRVSNRVATMGAIFRRVTTIIVGMGGALSAAFMVRSVIKIGRAHV